MRGPCQAAGEARQMQWIRHFRVLSALRQRLQRIVEIFIVSVEITEVCALSFLEPDW
jgi:hypothetical protein